MKNKILNSLISGLIGASIIVALVIMAKQNVAIEKSLPAPELSEQQLRIQPVFFSYYMSCFS